MRLQLQLTLTSLCHNRFMEELRNEAMQSLLSCFGELFLQLKFIDCSSELERQFCKHLGDSFWTIVLTASGRVYACSCLSPTSWIQTTLVVCSYCKDVFQKSYTILTSCEMLQSDHMESIFTSMV